MLGANILPMQLCQQGKGILDKTLVVLTINVHMIVTWRVFMFVQKIFPSTFVFEEIFTLAQEQKMTEL